MADARSPSTAGRQNDPAEMRPLNATAASLLGFLHEGPKTGWELVGTAEQRIGDFWSLTRSQVYRELSAMADAGLVEAGEVGPRERRPYELTAAGRQAFAAWLDGPPGDEQIRYPLLLTIAFGRYLPAGRLAQHVATHRERHRSRLEGYHAALAAAGKTPDAYGIATLQFGIRYEQAVLDWFEQLPPEIAGDEPARG